MRKQFLRKCVIGLVLLLMLAALTLLGSTSITQAQPPRDTVQIIVKFKAPDNSTAVTAAIQASGGRCLRDLPQLRTHVISVPAKAAENILAALAQDPSVERAATAVKFHKAGTPDDPGYTQQWALPKIAWDQVYGTTPITGSATIAVLDTGVNAGHPDLADRMGSGQSFVNGDANSDPNGHGTALAGIVAANVNNAVGIAGVAYDGVTVSSVQVLQPDGTGLDSDVIAGVVWAVDNGAKVILMGFSSADYSAALADALQYAWSKGAVLVAATGNDSSSAPSYPAGMENVLGVASTDQDDNVAADSNTGSACVAAPGLDIYTTMAGGNYGAISGTSAAAAETAGLAALLVTSEQSNDYIYDQVCGTIDPITGQSFGRINVATAMGEAVTPPPSPPSAPPPTPGPTPPVYAPAATITSTAAGGAWATGSTWVGGVAPATTDTVVIATTGAGNVSGSDTTSYTCAGLTINSGATLNMNRPLTVNGATSITGTVNWSSTSGTARLMTFNGAVTLNSGAEWNEITTSANDTFTFTNNFTNNATTFTGASTGVHTFSGASMTISGSTTTSIPRVTVSGTYTNNGTLTVSTALAGAGTLTNGATGTLNIGGTSTITTLTATAVGNTVNYTGAAQTAKVTTYDNLTLSGSGAKTFATTPTVNGKLSMEGTATVTVTTGVVTYGAAATLQYNTATARTASAEEWITPFVATGGVIIANTGAITLNNAKVFNATAPLTINSGATLAMSTFLLTLNGNLVNNGGTTSGSGGVTIAGTAAQSIGSFTNTGTVSMTKTGGTATFTGNVNGGAFTLSGSGGTLNLGTGLTHTFTGTWTRTAGTLNGGSSTLNIGGTVTNTAGTFTAGTSTVNYNGAGAQTIANVTYNNFTLSGSGAKTTTGATVNGILSMEGTATTTGTVATYGAAATLQYRGTGAQTTGVEFPATFGGSGGVIINNANGVTLNSSPTISSTLTLTSGTFAVGANTLTLNGPVIAGTPANMSTTSSSSLVFGGSSSGVNIPSSVTALNNLTINNANGVTLNSSPTISGTLTLSSGNITTGSYAVAIASGGSVLRTSGHVIGNLQKNVATGANVLQTFEVGTTSGYDPVTVTFASVTTAGNLTAKVTSGEHLSIGSSEINANKDVNLYWSLANSGIVFTSYSATFNFNTGDIDTGANTSIFIVGNFNGTTWTYPTVGARTSTSTQATGITSFGDFVVGEPKTFISFTITDYGSDGIKFGSLDPGMIDRPADQNPPTQGAVTLTVGSETNVAVNVQLKGDNFTGSGTIPISNVKYNNSNDSASASTMGKTYATWYTIPANAGGDVHQCYLWISIPAGKPPGAYTSTFYYQAIQQ